MRRILGFTVVVSLWCLLQSGVPVKAAALQQSKAEQELMQIERDWCAATVKKDATMLGRILTDDYAGVGSRGTTATKAEELADLKNAESSIYRLR